MSFPTCYAVSVPPGSTVPFYITDDNLNTAHRAVQTISTSGLVDFTINGIPISGPSTMIETGVDTGVFALYLTLPSTVNGKPLKDGDVVVMTYHQNADYSGNPTDITQSVTISQTTTSPISASQDRVRIGHTFSLKLYAPDWNLDSYKPDFIPLSLIEFRDGGLVTRLANSAFDIPTFGLRETGPDTNLFVAPVKIPKQVDGVPLEIGSTIEFSFTDPTEAPSPQTTRVHLTIGYADLQNTVPALVSSSGSLTLDSIKDATKVWCSGSKSDASFIQIIQNLATGKFVTISKLDSVSKTPLWLEKNTCWWSTGQIADRDFLSGIQFLINKGFLKV